MSPLIGVVIVCLGGAGVNGERLRHDAQQRTAAVEAQGQPVLRVVVPFRGPGGRTFAAGRTQATPELVEELQAWAERVESRAQGRTLGSMGYPTWPVFTVESPD